MKTHSITGLATRRWTVVVGAVSIGALVLLPACSGSSDSPAAAGTPSATATATATADATRTACDAALASDWVNIPGIDPDGPPASAAELAAWATPLQPRITALRAGVPADLTSKVDTLATAVRDATEGKPVSTDDASLQAALTAVNAWAHDSCDYPTLDVTNSDGGALSGVPATLPAGPVAIRFANTGTDPAKAGFILLLGKVRDGQTATAADVQAGKVNVEDIADIVAVAQPTGAAPAYALATLSAGRYVVTAPVGTPPQFSGVVAAGFEVG
ncbi:hypothetical protein [Parafrankia sp. EUN1f]|uniref:hypothetical protein n=1 Tax=Parafrankia sp. EUN1f TaxID=102897 RepID=UPI0001C46270|nr:hypothetical protein [Parafrankia sp. EUN1f]EFC83913.1 hypothetical protein FrEUN1fDRAFT_2967 [Parafrankia sp. EUN1f]